MAVQKLNHSLETTQQNNDSWQEFGDDQGNEETLSLCDLVMSSSDANEYWKDDDFCKDHRGNDEDFFEFFSSEDNFPATYPQHDNNIIFCGKLISRRENHQFLEDTPRSLKTKIKQENDGKTNISGCMFPWKMSHNSFKKSRTFPAPPPAKESQGKSLNKSLSLPATGYEKSGVSVKKVSALATPVKSGWYLFAFGIGRFPTEIELNDMKMRQSRKSKAMEFKVLSGSKPENVEGDKTGRRTAKGKGLWRLVKQGLCIINPNQ